MTNKKPLKIVLLGDPGTGKTSLLSRLTKSHFDPKYEPSPGIRTSAYAIQVGSQTLETDLWDLAGGEKYRCLANACLQDADGILLVYDVSNLATFENLAAWLSLIREAISCKTSITLVGNKNDLQSKVSRKEAEQFATDKGLSYIETSALNDSNVHLAFESIAQEINVAAHSVSEPSTDSFVQKGPKASSGHDDDKPFQIVLIDIEEAARGKTVCVEKPLEEANLEFIAISYRWGEVQEQVINTKLGYMASVTSFALADFYQLCMDVKKEPDLQSIKYVWVDAICVDQNNHDRRKATIYQMSNIYHRAAYIVAVPDLHLNYLVKSGIFDYETSGNTYNLNGFIYSLLHGKPDELVQVTKEWFDNMGIPEAEMARHNLTVENTELFTDLLQVYNLQDTDSSCDQDCYHNCYDLDYIDCHNVPKNMHDCIQYAINWCHYHEENDNKVYENSECTLCSLQMDMCKHQYQNPDKNEMVPGSDQKWLACVLKELQYDKYRRLVAERCQAVIKLMTYLESLIKDWSSRVWVISEYNIAKAKKSHKMKFWFLSLCMGMDNNVESLNFFVFDFDKTKEDDLFPPGVLLNRVISQADQSCCSFQKTLMSQLNERSFLKMMLDSKASRNEDRFYAIFPSSQYKNKLASREVVSSWQIVNVISVKLKLYELMTTKDKLDLLYLTANNQYSSTLFFPVFAYIDVTWWNVPPVKEQDEENHPCNFDLNDSASVRLVPPDVSLDNENGIHFYKLNISPKMYYAIHDRTDYAKEMFGNIFKEKRELWKTLAINNDDDELVFVCIPLYMRNIDTTTDTLDKVEHIALFGSFKKNKWLLCLSNIRHFRYDHFRDDLSIKRYDNSDGSTTFDIY